jgi:DNA-binding beta-propeller fold protein YncE
LDVDAAGNVYVLDATLKTINVYDADGDFLRNFGNASQLYKPAGLGVTPDGARVYAVDIGGSSSDEHKITVFNGVTGELISTLGKRGAGLGEFNLPRDVTIAPDGSIYVVDGGNFRVQKFDKEGKYISKFGALGRQSGQFSRPKEADVDPSGNVYVVDTAFGNFQIFNPDGQLLMAIGERSNSDGPGLYSLPSGIAVDDDGRVYVVDQFFRRVDIFRPAGLPEDGGWIGKFNPNKKDTESGAEQVVTDSKTGSDNVEQPIEPSQAVPASK